MKTFIQFCSEAYDKDVMGSSQITKTGEGGRVGAERKKTAPEMRRMSQKSEKGKQGQERKPTEYKPRKDIGTQKPRSEREQQPTQERGSAALSPKAAQRKAYLERKAREAGAKTATASELLKKKKTAAVDKRPEGQPKRAVVGMSRAERKDITRKGQEKLEKLVRQSEAEKQGKKPEDVVLTGGKTGEAETRRTGKPYKYRTW
jgi:hypothetical protein